MHICQRYLSIVIHCIVAGGNNKQELINIAFITICCWRLIGLLMKRFKYCAIVHRKQYCFHQYLFNVLFQSPKHGYSGRFDFSLLNVEHIMNVYYHSSYILENVRPSYYLKDSINNCKFVKFNNICFYFN